MIVKAPAKLNLTFEILGKREDGYHDIRSVMQTIDINDYLQVEKSDQFAFTGPMVCSIHDLLITKAVKVMEEAMGKSFPVWVHLDKTIPVMAGMGGGSSDAAAILYAVNNLYQLGLTKEQLIELGAKVGADVPFFIQGGKCLCEGFGEKVTPLPPEDPGYYIVFRPHRRLSTKQAYEDYDKTGVSFAEQARGKCPQLDDVFEVFPDAVVSGKGPTAFLRLSYELNPHLPAGIETLLPVWDGDIFVAPAVGR